MTARFVSEWRVLYLGFQSRVVTYMVSLSDSWCEIIPVSETKDLCENCVSYGFTGFEKGYLGWLAGNTTLVTFGGNTPFFPEAVDTTTLSVAVEAVFYNEARSFLMVSGPDVVGELRLPTTPSPHSDTTAPAAEGEVKLSWVLLAMTMAIAVFAGFTIAVRVAAVMKVSIFREKDAGSVYESMREMRTVSARSVDARSVGTKSLRSVAGTAGSATTATAPHTATTATATTASGSAMATATASSDFTASSSQRFLSTNVEMRALDPNPHWDEVLTVS